jgi:dUTP pyrophosphatase
MDVKIKRIDETLPLPIYETDGSVGFDLITREDTTIKAGKVGLVPANVTVEVPQGHMLIIASRSSTPRKKGLLTPHGFGIIDHDYCGPDDEVMVQVFNFGDEDAEVKRGEKIAQGVFVKIEKITWKEADNINNTSRGGFGSTDEDK